MTIDKDGDTVEFKKPLKLSYCKKHDDFYVGERCLVCAYEYRYRFYKRTRKTGDPEAIKAHNLIRARYRDWKKRVLVEGTFSYEDWLSKVEEYNNCCAYCGKPLNDKMTIDHVIPLTRGGTNDIDNLVPCCRSCNSAKHTKTGDEFRVSTRFKRLEVEDKKQRFFGWWQELGSHSYILECLNGCSNCQLGLSLIAVQLPLVLCWEGDLRV